MRHPFLSFLLVVILPAGAAMGFAFSAAGAAWADVQQTSHARIARMALAVADAELRERADDPAGPARSRAAPLVGRSTGYSVAVYRDGARWTATEPAPGPEALPPAVASEVGPGEPLPAGPDPAAGAWVARTADQTPPGLVALAVPRTPAGGLLALPVVLVMGLLLLFGALTGWIQLARRDLHDRRLPLGGVMGPALVPALASLVFFIHVDRSFRDAAYAAAAQDLSRGLAVAAAAGATDDPMRVQALTGVDATRVRAGNAEASSLSGELGTVAALPSPPSSFTSSGTVLTADGPSAYVSLRVEDDAVLVATAPLPEQGVADLRKTLFGVGLVLAGWWALAAAGAWLTSWLTAGGRPTGG